MKHFAELFRQLDTTTKTNKKVAALADYFSQAEDRDRLWTIALLSHRRPRRSVNSKLLRAWAGELAGIDIWLLEESYHVVGDLAETIALVLPPPEERHDEPLHFWIEKIQQFPKLTEEERKAEVVNAWRGLEKTERYLFNKLITGNFRVGVSQKLMTRALARAMEIPEDDLAHRLMGNWTPDETTFDQLVLSDNPQAQLSRPYPFYLAYQLEQELKDLGAPEEWQVEHKWDGIRGQLIVRGGETFVWSRGEELVTDKYPEYQNFHDFLPNGTVIDGEILAFTEGKPLGFNILQTRIGRKKVSKKTLQEAPVVLMAYDLLEYGGEDIRERPMNERRKLLEKVVSAATEMENESRLLISPTVQFTDWDELPAERATARERHSEGLMLKRKNSTYKVGRKKGDWWKWKIDPLTIDAVMMYAQRGHGRRANLYTDFTFGVWDGETLVPFTKAYSGMTDKEFNRITAWVRKNTVDRFGPVRSVKPHHVFEIGFEGIQKSSRHKSGVALRFPRMLRWREDKPKEEANTIEDLRAMLEQYG
ncbi:ATP-dependent DNA ligase [Lewinellaceae bacterium SD302]|nr:ATP-dependent DNA ligase [Lewinellaceae bacterium SD302]